MWFLNMKRRVYSMNTIDYLVVLIGKIRNCELKYKSVKESLENVVEKSAVIYSEKHVSNLKNILGKLYFLDVMSWILYQFFYD